MNIIVPLLLIATSIGLFFGYTKTTYDSLAKVREKKDKIEETLSRVDEIKKSINTLTESYNSIQNSDKQNSHRVNHEEGNPQYRMPAVYRLRNKHLLEDFTDPA